MVVARRQDLVGELLIGSTIDCLIDELPVQRVRDFGGGNVMSVYEFECKACGKHFEVSIPISEYDRLKKEPPRCPQCGKSRVQQLVSNFNTKAPSKY